MGAKLIKGLPVVVLAGKDRGKTGKVLHVNYHSGKVIVEGVNMVKRATRPSQANPAGGFIDREAPLHISNVAAIDPESKHPTRIGFAVKDGKKIRIARKSGKALESEGGAK